MKPIGIIDLHCDTLTKKPICKGAFPNTLDDTSQELALSKIPENVLWAQFFAVFVPDAIRGKAAEDYFDYYSRSFYAQMEAQPAAVPCRSFAEVEAAFRAKKAVGILTVESGAALGGKLPNVDKLAAMGVKAMTLVWNGENELGSGHDTAKGLTAFGREAVARMEETGILVDVSHLNDKGFEELLSIVKKPFIASHSNARAVTAHKRNLPDGFIKEIVQREGLIGLNYHRDFLNDHGGAQSFDDLLRHTMHFLELGAEKILALGSDYDGANIAPCLNSMEKALHIYDYFVAHGIAEETAEAILFSNAYRFFEKNL